MLMNYIIVWGGMILLAAAICLVIFCVGMAFIWHVKLGVRARNAIEHMRYDPSVNQGIRLPAYILYYAISWTSYISMLVVFFSGLWVFMTVKDWVFGSSE